MVVFKTEKERKAQVKKSLDSVFPGKRFYLSGAGHYVEIVWYFEDGVTKKEMETFASTFKTFIPETQISLMLTGVSCEAQDRKAV